MSASSCSSGAAADGDSAGLPARGYGGHRYGHRTVHVAFLRREGHAAGPTHSGGGWPFGSSLRVFGSQSDGLSVGSGAGLADAVRGEERGRVVSADVGQGEEDGRFDSRRTLLEWASSGGEGEGRRSCGGVTLRSADRPADVAVPRRWDVAGVRSHRLPTLPDARAACVAATAAVGGPLVHLASFSAARTAASDRRCGAASPALDRLGTSTNDPSGAVGRGDPAAATGGAAGGPTGGAAGVRKLAGMALASCVVGKRGDETGLCKPGWVRRPRSGSML